MITVIYTTQQILQLLGSICQWNPKPYTWPQTRCFAFQHVTLQNSKYS